MHKLLIAKITVNHIQAAFGEICCSKKLTMKALIYRLITVPDIYITDDRANLRYVDARKRNSNNIIIIIRLLLLDIEDRFRLHRRHTVTIHVAGLA